MGVWMGCWEGGGGRVGDEIISCPVYCCFSFFFSYILLVVIYVVLS